MRRGIFEKKFPAIEFTGKPRDSGELPEGLRKSSGGVSENFWETLVKLRERLAFSMEFQGKRK
jgi:hypothetical protein